MSELDDRVPSSLPPSPPPTTMLRPVMVLVTITLVGIACVFAMWWYFSTVTSAAEPTPDAPHQERVESNK